MKIAICSLAAVLIGVLLLVTAKLNDKNTSLPHISRQNDFQEHDIFHFRDSLMHQKAAADGARYYSLDDKNHRKYNTFFVVRRDYPDKYSICSHLWFDAKYAVTSKDFHLFVKCFSPDKNRPECVRLYYGVSGCYSIVTLRQPFQGTALVNAADYRLPWGKFFCKTTTSPDGKIASSGNELAAGESGYFLFPLYSRKPVSAVDFGRIVDLIKKPVSHN